HELTVVNPGGEIGDEAHAWVNRPAVRTSSFAVYLVAARDAVEPMYGTRARDYCLIEAGAILQTLMAVAAGAGLGLCPVGEVDPDVAGTMLRLSDHHELLHTILGGSPDPDHHAARDREARMLRRLDGVFRTAPVPDGGA
ncbi:SagB/ThcOx family dehydrogenase, partial [Micromonospora sp. NPDC051296]|uniref:SagB/ThcOx family dehydrogenase n=1 Tax=Micromonospora sp. NPDC051296 TaxID=3155046 RepID=UPI0034228874